jgi:pyruvate dehydrogenase E2 component (dihydrolipoamide acetyltransferase)
MAIPITIPRLGWNMEEGVFVGWLRRDGDEIKAGDAIFSLESDKATEDVECMDGGILRIPPNSPQPAQSVKVGEVIGYLLQPGESWIPEAASILEKKKSEPTKPRVSTLPSAMYLDKSSAIAISPRARHLARELGVDWKNLKGTGRTGRIRERDIRAANRGEPLQRVIQTLPSAPLKRGTATRSPIRRIIAERMRRSLNTTAPVTLTTTADVENLMKVRQQLKISSDEPSITDLFVKLAAIALAKHPRLNSRWENDRVVEQNEINVSIAVDTEAGLMAPVIRDVLRLSLQQVAAQARDLIDRARGDTLRIKEMEGGTFTITNLGSYGVDAFTPIINWPECAILGIGRIRQLPVVVDEQIVPRKQVTLSLTFDHRIADGADAARFLQSVVTFIENPDLEMLGSY